MKKADMHLHTSMSDGLLSPQELILKIKNAGITIFSITDHDTVAALDEMKRRSEFFGLTTVPGVELSAEYNNVDMHFTGYFINYHSKRFLDYLYLFRRRRFQRAQEILIKLKKLGITISIDRITELAGNGPIGRPHLADAMIEVGTVDSRNEAFDKYLNKDGPVYVEKYRITAQEVIELIHSIGGAAFLAHPGINDLEKTIPEIKELGLDGIEIIHPKHNEDQTKRLEALAGKMSLLTTGGSDFHGGEEDENNLGKFYVTEESVNSIRDYCDEHRSEWIPEDSEEESGSKEE
ncbi:MAG: PHP domain-containing protein [bacterium]|nr:PHP domain-containing protein [bacterium]